MNNADKDIAKTLSEARRKNAAAAAKVRYAELDRLTGMSAAERIAELNNNKYDREWQNNNV